MECWYSGINALAAVIVAVLTACIWWTARKQWEATSIAANAALGTATSLAAAERAYVFANISEATLPQETGHSPGVARMSILFVNYGKTPAIIRRSRATVRPLASTPQEFGSHLDDRDYFSDGLVLAPTEGEPDRTLTTMIQGTITPADMVAAKGGERTIYCYGVLEYRDIFGNDRETGFCWHYNAQSIRHSNFEFSSASQLNYRT